MKVVASVEQFDTALAVRLIRPQPERVIVRCVNGAPEVPLASQHTFLTRMSKLRRVLSRLINTALMRVSDGSKPNFVLPAERP